jgi:nucleoside-diphosphate-sugar epimerase
MCADITLAKKKLGYHPRVSLQEGLALMISKDPRFQPKE